jgi:hypothetical protein
MRRTVLVMSLLLIACGDTVMTEELGDATAPNDAVRVARRAVVVTPDATAFASRVSTLPDLRAERAAILTQVLDAHPEIAGDELLLSALRGNEGVFVAALPPEFEDIQDLVSRLKALDMREVELDPVDPRIEERKR